MNLQKSSKIIQKKNIQDHPKSLGFSFRNKKTTSKKSSKLNPQPSPFPLSDPTDTAVSSQAVTELKKTSQSFELGILKIPTDRVIVLMERSNHLNPFLFGVGDSDSNLMQMCVQIKKDFS